MDWIVDRTFDFFAQNIPAWSTIVGVGPIGFGWALVCLAFAGVMKRRCGLRTGYTRKIFHFLIFSTVAVIQWRWGLPSVCLFGGMATCVVFLAVFFGDGNLLYEALAREKDEPHRTHYIVIPYIATLLGGLLGNILFGPVAIIGYLTTGLGDAVGEPVGTRFGRHPYRVPSFTSVKATRSWEGSAAVCVMCVVGIVLGVVLAPDLSLSESSWIAIPFLAVACTGAEAVSPHGWDNLTMQLVPSGLALLVL